MEQDQFKISFPLRNKLLLGIVLLFLLAIAFLTGITLNMFQEDKQSYVLTLQNTEATLAGKEFDNQTKRVVDTLRQILALVDPSRNLTKNEASKIKAIVKNQPTLVGLDLKFLNIRTARTSPILRTIKEKRVQSLGISDSTMDVRHEWLKIHLADLATGAVTFFNLSRVGSSPLLGVALPDPSVRRRGREIPLAIGFISLRGFLSELQSSQVTIANRAGWILFDSDPSVLFKQGNISKDPLFTEAVSQQPVSGAKVYMAKEVEVIGSYYRPHPDLVVITRTPMKKAMASAYKLTAKFVLFAGMSIGVAILFAILFSKSLTAPLIKLYDATKEVAKGNFNLSLQQASKDEIGALSASFNVMSQKISGLIEDSMEKVRIEAELEIASTVQQTLIPQPLYRDKNIFIRSYYEPASQCGGDWWGFFSVGNKTVLLIADATGHGLPSALVTAAARSCFSLINKLADEIPNFPLSPSVMLSHANRVIYEATSGTLNMTFFAGVLDFDKNTITYSSAGHNPPWLFRNEKGKIKVSSLTVRGTRLGESREGPKFTEKSMPFKKGDILVLYTDGIIEGMDAQGNEFGKKRVRKLIQSKAKAGPDAILDHLISEFKDHNGTKLLDDDVTLAIVQFHAGTDAPIEVSGEIALTDHQSKDDWALPDGGAEPTPIPDPNTNTDEWVLPESGTGSDPDPEPEPKQESKPDSKAEKIELKVYQPKKDDDPKPKSEPEQVGEFDFNTDDWDMPDKGVEPERELEKEDDSDTLTDDVNLEEIENAKKDAKEAAETSAAKISGIITLKDHPTQSELKSEPKPLEEFDFHTDDWKLTDKEAKPPEKDQQPIPETNTDDWVLPDSGTEQKNKPDSKAKETGEIALKDPHQEVESESDPNTDDWVLPDSGTEQKNKPDSKAKETGEIALKDPHQEVESESDPNTDDWALPEKTTDPESKTDDWELPDGSDNSDSGINI